MATNGIRLITPTSVDVTGAGSSATINAGGSVTFSTAATLSLNGVFSSTYDNYIIDMRHQGSTGISLRGRLRLSGSDNSTANSYVDQYLDADSTTIGKGRTTTNLWNDFGSSQATRRDGITYYFYGPALAQPTAFRMVSVSGYNDAYLFDSAGTHNQSTAYDGLTFTCSTGSFTGLIKVYGLVQ